MRALILLFVLILVAPAQGQPSIVLTLVIDYSESVDAAAVLEEFEAAHPGVDVVIEVTALEDRIFDPPRTVEDVPAFIEKVRSYARRGDVLYMEGFYFNTELVKTGTLLNLSPLIQADEIETAPAFVWDGGIYALPAYVEAGMLVYDREAFDAAGLAYPDVAWTLDDLIHAGETLTVYDDDGRVKLPAMNAHESVTGIVLRSTIGTSVKRLDDAVVAQALEKWQPYVEKTMEDFAPAFMEHPIYIGGTNLLVDVFPDRDLQTAPLPGGLPSLFVSGYAVSAGTAYPELSYALAKALSTDQTIDNALPQQEVYFLSYAHRALDLMPEMDAFTALQRVQAEVDAILTAIENESAVLPPLVVATPIPAPTTSAEGVTLTFGLGGFQSPLPNKNLWDAAMESFVAQDGEVTGVRLDNRYKSLEEHLTSEDCFYLNANIVPTTDLAMLRSLDGLMDADAAFDPQDFVHGTLEQVTRDGAVWGMPVNLTPIVMWFHRDQLQRAGVPEPVNGWTVSEFEDALRQLGNDRPPFRTEAVGSDYLLMLMAAYGGHLIDISQTPPIYRFGDEASIEASRQVLNLGKEGYIHYQALASRYGGFFGSAGAPLYISYLDTGMYRDSSSPYRPVTFPRGVYTPVSYGLGVLYASAHSLHPEACYRWMNHMVRQPGLFNAMPARRSLLDVYADGEDLLAFYREYDALLQRPDAVYFPWRFDGTFDNLHTPELSVRGMAYTWFGRVFDDYVLEDGDLDAGMRAIQQYITEYRVCVQDFPSRSWREMTPEESEVYFGQFTACALAIDPTLEEYFGN